jgi:hypothetical protein
MEGMLSMELADAMDG